jgi:hypothetical protein
MALTRIRTSDDFLGLLELLTLCHDDISSNMSKFPLKLMLHLTNSRTRNVLDYKRFELKAFRTSDAAPLVAF